jgi:hypothetical protein
MYCLNYTELINTSRGQNAHYFTIRPGDGDMGWCCWFKYSATSRKDAGPIPDGVTGIFH